MNTDRHPTDTAISTVFGDWLQRHVSRRSMLYAGLLLNVEVILVLLYWVASPTTIRNPLISVYPFVWINLAPSYLVFVTLLDVNGSALSGALGFASCVSCTWPILGTAVTALFGGGSILATVATNQPYGLSTFVFATSVGLLVWRPFANLRGWLPGR